MRLIWCCFGPQLIPIKEKIYFFPLLCFIAVMILKSFLPWTTCCALCFVGSSLEAAPKNELGDEKAETILLRSIAVVGEEAAPPSFAPDSVEFNGVPPSTLLFNQLQSALGSNVTEALLEELKERVAQCYQPSQNELFFVTLPDQNLSYGTLRINVHQAKAGQICYTKTQWFKQSSFEKQIPLHKGERIDRQKLLNNTAWSNRNPFHNTTIVFIPGASQGTTDVEFLTQERFPFRFYGGVENTGIKAPSSIRFFAGGNWGNAFGIGDLLTIQATFAPRPHQFLSFFAKYDSYLPWQHILSLFGGYARIHPEIPDFQSEGQDGQASLYYTIPFKPLYTPFLHELTFGLDYKSMNSNLFFQDLTPLVTKTVQITTISAIYSLQDQIGAHNLSLKGEVHYSPFAFLPDQTKARYKALREGAPVHFAYGKVEFSDLYQFHSRWTLSLLARGQGATAPLLPSEQFGLGGYDTVRGYLEHAFNTDNAACANLELLYRFYQGSKRNFFELLAFCDYGWGHNWKSRETVPATQYLLGVGPGVRWNTSPYLSLRVDYGFQLHNVEQDRHFGRFHFRALASF